MSTLCRSRGTGSLPGVLDFAFYSMYRFSEGFGF